MSRNNPSNTRHFSYLKLLFGLLCPLPLLWVMFYSHSENQKTLERVISSRQTDPSICIGPRLDTPEARDKAMFEGYYNAHHDCIDKAAYEALIVARQKPREQAIKTEQAAAATGQDAREQSGQAVAPVKERITSLELSAPGIPLSLVDFQNRAAADTNDYLKQQNWHSLAIEESQLVIGHVAKTRASDWLAVRGKAAFGSEPVTDESFQADGMALDLPANAIFALRMNDGHYSIKPGSYLSAIAPGQKLQDKWQTTVLLGKEEWTISASYERRRDGKPIDGSMALRASNANGRTIPLISAGGKIYERQEILWLGDLNGDDEPDLLLKETTINGVIDYTIVLGSAAASFSDDPDHPIQEFSSGVDEESNEIRKHRDQKWLFPEGGRFGQSAFNIPEEIWNERVRKGEEEGMPALIADRMLKINGENIRFTFQYLPGPSPTANARASGPIVLIRAYFRGKSQVLMQESLLDGGPLRVQVDTMDGEPSIEISSSPHYNNSYTRYWIWRSSQGERFRRLSAYQSQGC